MALLLVATTSMVALLAPPQVTPAAATGGAWPVYHGDFGGSGVASGPSTFSSATRAWLSKKLKGKIYGEPLVADGLVVVATESNWVYALNESTGAIVWSRHVGAAVSARALPCGNIAPTVGITSTPVIDTTTSKVFVVADEHVRRVISHHLIGLSLTTGVPFLNQAVDPPGTTPSAQLQRAALTLDDGNVIIGSGGNAGDCSTYNGWVVSVPEGGGPLSTFEVDPSPGNLEGAVWMGGAAPVIDPSGNIWVATGNGSNTSGSDPDFSDSVVELSPLGVGGHLPVVQTFSPASWASDNATDADLGSSAPAVLPSGVVLQAGKSQTAFLLDQSALGGVGGQVSELDGFCGNDVDGGVAYQGSVVYLPCLNGVTAVQVQTSPPLLTQLWTDASGSPGPAIVANGLVWSIDQGGTLWGMSPADGSAVVQLSIGPVANHFPTPSVTDGRLFAAGSNRVSAFTLTP